MLLRRFCRSWSTTRGNGGVTNRSWTGRSVVTYGTRSLTDRSPEGAMVIETVVSGGSTVSALMNPNGIPAIAQGCRAGEVTLGHMPMGDTNRNAVAAIEGIDPHPGMGDERVATTALRLQNMGTGFPGQVLVPRPNPGLEAGTPLALEIGGIPSLRNVAGFAALREEQGDLMRCLTQRRNGATTEERGIGGQIWGASPLGTGSFATRLMRTCRFGDPRFAGKPVAISGSCFWVTAEPRWCPPMRHPVRPGVGRGIKE